MKERTPQWARALFFALDGKNSSEQKKVLRRALHILTRQKREYIMYDVMRSLERLVRAKREVKIVLARNHAPGTVKKLQRLAMSLFGKETFSHVVIDPKLVGGFQMKGGEMVVNASLHDAIENFKHRVQERI
jgi:F0F1-type ATP synthase delta subunit